VSTKPTLFLSYRRDSSADLARYLHDRLTALGVDVFFDVESINGGRFAAIIEKEIITREHFLVILTSQTLASEWVGREIETALKHRLNIIPLITQGFDFTQPLPPEIKDLANYSGIPYDFQDPNRAIDRILKAIGVDLAPPSPTLLRRIWGIGDNPTLIGWVTIIALILAFTGITLNTLLPHPDALTPVPTLSNTATAVNASVVALLTSATMTPTSKLNPTNTSTPASTVTVMPTLTLTNTPSFDVPGTIMTATNAANTQSTEIVLTVFATYTKTAMGFTKTLTVIPSSLIATSEPMTVVNIMPTVITQAATNVPNLTPQTKTGIYLPVTQIDPDFNYAYALVPAGSFADIGGSANDAFQIGVFPVTNRLYAPFLTAHGNQSDHGETRFNDSFGESHIHFIQGQWQIDPGYENHPVVNVSFAGAKDFCAYFGSRLPTSTEYRKAAVWSPVTHQTSLYPWGDNPPTSDLANYGSAGTASVTAHVKGQSAVGAYDMTGNVREWTATAVGVNQVQLGGGWNDEARLLKIGAENLALPSFASNNVGFRCVR